MTPYITTQVYIFIIHPCDPTVVICYLIWTYDIAVCITYLISQSYSLTYNLRIFQFGCIINTKLPSCDDIIHRTSLGFPSWCSESTRPTDSCFQRTSCENLMMYDRLYQHTWVVLYIYHEFNLQKIIYFGSYMGYLWSVFLIDHILSINLIFINILIDHLL